MPGDNSREANKKFTNLLIQIQEQPAVNTDMNIDVQIMSAIYFGSGSRV